jgi:hypothetical protein
VLTYGLTYDHNRYSPLKQINKSNVKRLVPVWNVSLQNDLGEQAQPIIYDGVMFVSNARWTYAIDALTGRVIWRTAVEYDAGTPSVVCCGVSNKGVAIFEGKVFRTTLDAHVVALDQKTGKELWKQKVAEWKEGYSLTVAPLIANGVLITGCSGAEFGARCFLDGWDPATGKKLWRRYTTAGPGRERLRDLGAARDLPARRREHVDYRLVRSGARSRLLGHRQCRALERRQAQGRQPVRRVGARGPSEDGRDRVALPVRPQRHLGLGFLGNDPGRDSRGRPEAQGRHARGAQRLPVRPRPQRTASCFRRSRTRR